MTTGLDELCDYFAGSASASVRSAVADELRRPDTGASKLLAHASATADRLLAPGPVSIAAKLYYSRFGRVMLRRRALICVLLLLTIGGSAWALVTRRPLLRDDFTSNRLDASKWQEGTRPVVRAEHGYMRLQNRGFLVSKAEFDGPFSLTLDWRWVNLSNDPSYYDDLTIAVHTSGEPRPQRPWEATDGLLIRISAGPGTVSVARGTSAGEMPHIASTEANASYPPSSQWCSIRIVDTGKELQIYLNCTPSGAQSDVPIRDVREPILVAPYEDKPHARHIAIYNREFVGGVPHESHIDNVRVYRHP